MMVGTRWVWRTGLAAAGLFVGMAAHGQTVMAADEIAVAPYEESYDEPPPAVVYREEETYAEVPVRRPPVEVEVLPPREVFAVVRERGFEPMGPARRHGPVYSISVLDPNGDEIRTWTLSDPSDIIGDTVGGNRYGWFPNIEQDFVAFDDTSRTS